MKKKFLSAIICSMLATSVVLTGCGNNSPNYEGTYTGTAWKGQAEGVTLEEAKDKITSTITVDSKGKITDAKFDFLVNKDGNWITRNNPEATVTVDFSVDPTAATLNGEESTKGASMFDVKANDAMSLYSVAVNEDGTVSVMLVDATTRYRYEAKLSKDFNFETKLADAKIGETWIPTLRESSGGAMKITDWSEVNGKTIFGLSPFNHVMTRRGVLEGLSDASTMKELVEALGVTFENGVAKPMEAIYGYHSNGGWEGNYTAISEFLVGKNIEEVTGLVDYSEEKFAKAINEDNFFGIDVPSGATKTVQDSFDTISGATVRMSRENEAYQRALVDAGILKEEDIIKGRF